MVYGMILPVERTVESVWARDFCLCVLLVALSFLAYSRGFGSEFVFDSVMIVGRDPRVGEFNADSIADIFRENYWWPTVQSNAYRPISTFLFLVQRTVFGFGFSPVGYQMINLMLHVAVVFAAFKLLLRLGLPVVWAFWACAWFSVHPYVSEVVPNVVGLSDILAFGAIVWGFHIYLDMLDRRMTAIRGILALGLIAVMGLLSKESAVSLVGLVFWHGVTLGRERVATLWTEAKEGRGLMIAALAFILVAILATIIIPRLIHENMDLGDGRDLGIVDNPLLGESPLVARVNAFSIFGGNIINCLVPTTISADYSFGQIRLGALPPVETWDWVVCCRALGVFLFGLSGLLLFFRWPPFSFCVGAVFVMATPTANLVMLIGTIRADRLIYPVILPVLVCSGMLATALWSRVTRSRGTEPARLPGASRLAMVFCALFVGLLALLTNFRSTDWRTNEAFWQAAYETSPGSFKTKLGLASIDREPSLEQINKDIALAKAALLQLQASPFESVRKTDLATEVYAACLIKRVRLQSGKVPTENLDTDLNEALGAYTELLGMRVEIERLMKTRRAEKGKPPEDSHIKKDGILVAIADILRFRGEHARGLEILSPYYDECLLSSDYLFALARLHVGAGNVRDGLECYIKITLLHPDNTDVAAEAAWVLKHNSLPGYAKAYASKAEKLMAEGDARLNISDTALAEIVRTSVLELNEWLEKKGDAAMRSIINRRLRVFLGDDIL